MGLLRSLVSRQMTDNLKKINGDIKMQHRSRITTRSGAIFPEPKAKRFDYLGVICSVTAGLVTGTILSQMMANSFEEKELSIPSDDDDDD
ncbi:unnamed protein product [Xylocopa violacea]|uniref:Essential MCU regulator, mitochondrial n=1 Tax=Xylocopa violacea TaxID=135666 RepID=A0ABP1P9V9_XYLVO